MSEPIVELRNVDVCLGRCRVLKSIDWAFGPAQHWAVLGGNGAGKSTFLKLIRGEVWPAPGRGERIYRIDGDVQRSAVGVKERMPMVSPEAQDRYLQLEWKHRVLDVIHSGWTGTDYLFEKPGPAPRAEAEKIIRLLGLDDLLKRDVQELSTGELRRVLIARALVSRPPILLLDEVCDGLDAPARRMLLAALESIAQSGTQLIYTTHREAELAPAITHRVMLRNGRIVSQGPVEPTPKRSSPKNSAQKSSREQNSKSTDGFVDDRRASPVLVRIAGANVYLNCKPVLRGIDWQMRDGENWAVLGGNGAGKSTFLKLVCGDIHPALGARVQRFKFTPRNTLWELRRRIGFISPGLQAGYREPLTGREVVASGFFSSVGLLDRVSAAQWRRVDELFAAFAMASLSNISAHRMSYGEFRKILLLRTLVHGPKLLVSDEPFDGLDTAAKKSFADALGRVAANGTRLLTVTHHIDELPAATTHALVLENGRIVCQGELAQVRCHPAARRLFDE